MSKMILIIISAILMGVASISHEPKCSDGTLCYYNGTESRCCRYTGGVCCSDGVSCCPQNTECDLRYGVCISKNHLGMPLLRNLHSVVPLSDLEQETAKPEVCSATSRCPAGSNCCPVPYIGHDCCPVSNGVCCGDYQHCCPFDTRCDLRRGNCVSTTNSTRVPWYRKMRATPARIASSVDDVECQDATLCPDLNTCCPVGGGAYGCCPFQDAVCCSDFTHCCPNGMICNLQSQTCIQAASNGQMLSGFQLLKSIEKQKNRIKIAPKANLDNVSVICPGGRYSCPDWMTCCVASGGKYGCCPFPNGVCCSDDKHCCPNGSVCDLTHDACTRGGRVFPLGKKLNANKVTIKTNVTATNNRICPNNQSCPDLYTCCQLPSSAYGCCPYSNAVCCEDHVHCCPQETVCDLAGRGCRQGNEIQLHSFGNISLITKDNMTSCRRHPTGDYL